MIDGRQVDESLGVVLFNGQGFLPPFQISYRYGFGDVGVDQLLPGLLYLA